MTEEAKKTLGLPVEGLPAEMQVQIREYMGGAAEDVKGMTPELPRIELVHQGTCMIKLSEDVVVKEFDGIIVHNHAQNAWWEKAIEDRDPNASGWPQCFSMDGVAPVPDCEARQAASCRDCPHDKYGSDRRGRGKACKNMRRLFVFIPGQEFPHVMNIPPTSIKLWGKYVTRILNELGSRPRFILTKFKAEQAENAEGTKFTKLALSPVRLVNKDEIMKVMTLAPQCEAYSRPPTQDDYMGTGDAVASEGTKAPF